jgi:Tfp pilus tip-associated adhesin PilY1
LRNISGASDGLTPSTALTNSIAGDIRVLDMDRNGALDRLYFADTGGIVWRVDMDVDLVDGAVSPDKTFYDYSKARLSKFADLTGTDKRMFFFEPDVALMENQGKTLLFLSIGSGNRAQPLATGTHDRFYVMVDRNPYDKPDSSIFPLKDGQLVSADDATALGSGLLANAALKGWYYSLPDAEKVLASATTVLNKVVFTTFTPGSADTTASCAAQTANARAYVLDLFTGQAVADLDRKGGKERSTIAGENEVLDTAQLIFHSPSTVEAKACTNKADCKQQLVEVRVGKMNAPLLDSSNSLTTGAASSRDMDIGSILPRMFWRDDDVSGN